MGTMRRGRMPRQHFTQDDDKLLAKYLSKYAPRPQGRSGNLVYKALVEDADRKWSWSKNHTWQSWRERYYKNKDDFDRTIRRYQLKKDKQGAQSESTDGDRASPNAEAAEEEEGSSEQLEGQGKRAKRKADDVQDGHRDKRGKVDEVSMAGRPQEGPKATPAVEPSAPDASRHETKETEEDEDRNVIANGVESNVVLLSQANTSSSRDQRGGPIVPAEDGKIYPKLETLSPPQLPADHLPRAFEPDVLLQPSVPLLTVDTTRQSTEVTVEAEKQKEPSGLGKTTSPSRPMPSTTQATVRRKVQRRVNADEDFFASSSSPEPSTTGTPLKSQPRQVVEGPFRTSFGGAKLAQASESERADESRTDFKPSAPTSAKGKGKEISEPPVVTIPTSQVDRHADVDTGAARPIGSIHGEMTTAIITERSKLPKSSSSEHHPFSQPQTMHRVLKHPPSQLNGHMPVPAPLPANRASSHAGGTPVQSARKEGQVPSSSRASISNLQPKKTTAGRSEERTAKSKSAPSEPLDVSPILRMPLTRQAVATLAGPSTTRRTPSRFESSRGEVGRPSSRFPTPENPFIAKRGKGKQKEKVPALTLFDRRHTIASMDSHERPAFRLNGRQSLPSRLSISTSASTSASGGQRRRESLLPVEVAEEDRPKVDYLGMSTAVAMMAKNFAFREEVVWRAWELTGSIAKTEEFLGRLRAKTEEAAAEILEDMERAGEIVFPSYVEDDAEPRINLADVLSAPTRKSDSSPLRIMPPPPDDDAMSDYTPPPSSRAGQLLRLAKQGRLDEAMKREARRASGANRHLQRIDVSQESMSRDASRQLKPGRDSPTPLPRGRPETPNLSSVLRTDSSPPPSPSRPRTLTWTAELETMFMSAKQDDLERLREIEQQLDPDFLRRWTANKLADVKRRPDWKPLGRRS